MNSQYGRITVALLLCVALSACTTTRRALNFDTEAALEVNVSGEVNPDTDGRASPVVVTLFQLKERQRFDLADFIKLYENPNEALGTTLRSQTRLREFIPGTRRVEEMRIEEEVKYIGILAEYIQFDSAKTKLVLPVVESASNEFRIVLDHLAVLDVTGGN